MLDTVLEQLNGPAGIGVALVVALVVLFLVRKILSLVFFVLALALAGWSAALYFGWDIPYVLPGKLTDAARSAMEATRRALGADDARVGTESLSPGARSAIAPETPSAQSAAEEVGRADIAYNAPDAMVLNMPVDLRLVVDPTGKGNPESQLAGLPGETRTGEAQLTRQVTASLYGAGFDIRPLKPERQLLDAAAISTWQWEVTPREEGPHTLFLEVFAHPGGGAAAAPVKKFEDQIEVKVTLASRALSFAQTTQPVLGLIAAVVSLTLAAAGLVTGRRERRRIAPT